MSLLALRMQGPLERAEAAASQSGIQDQQATPMPGHSMGGGGLFRAWAPKISMEGPSTGVGLEWWSHSQQGWSWGRPALPLKPKDEGPPILGLWGHHTVPTGGDPDPSSTCAQACSCQWLLGTAYQSCYHRGLAWRSASKVPS